MEDLIKDIVSYHKMNYPCRLPLKTGLGLADNEQIVFLLRKKHCKLSLLRSPYDILSCYIFT